MTSKRRSRILPSAAGLFVVACIVGAAVWALLGRRADEPAEPDAVPEFEEQLET